MIARTHAVEAEQSLLGGLMLDQRAWDQIADVVTADDLYQADHRLIFGAVAALVERNQPPDAVTVSEHLQRSGQLEAAGGLPYLARLVEDTPSAANIRAYARIVRDHAERRRLAVLGRRLATDAETDSDLAALVETHARAVYETAEAGKGEWRDPVPLPDGLPAVPKFDYELLPRAVRDRVADIAERMQCPPDFPAVAMMTMLSGVVGRRATVRPKRADDWTVTPNLWGMVIGRPGIMKSPAVDEVLRPLQTIQERAMEEHRRALAAYEAESIVRDERKRVAKDDVRKALKRRDTAAADGYALDAVAAEPVRPSCRRWIVNDTTVEKLGELLAENPDGILMHRDELTGFFRTLDRQGHEADRAFYLEAWKGDEAYTYDRIGRGTLHIPSVCLAILGSIQPGPLSTLVRSMRGGGDDGLLQRFQLAVWPDQVGEWRNIDRRPDDRARDEINALVTRIANAAPLGDSLRFDEPGQSLFDGWRAELERRIRGDLHPMIEAHLSKYRSLVPALALLCHVAEASDSFVSAIREVCVVRAIAWANYLEQHARRIYAPAIAPDMDAARALAARIIAGDLGERFALRDLYRKDWSLLATVSDAEAAVRVLTDHEWLREFREPTPGRTRTFYVVNPAVRRKP